MTGQQRILTLPWHVILHLLLSKVRVALHPILYVLFWIMITFNTMLPSSICMYCRLSFLTIVVRSPVGHQSWPTGSQGSKTALERCLKSFNSRFKLIRCPADFYSRLNIFHSSFKYRPIFERWLIGECSLREEMSGNKYVSIFCLSMFTHCRVRPAWTGVDQIWHRHRPATGQLENGHRPCIGRTI